MSNPASLFHANTFHPAPYSLAASEHMIGVAIQTLPVRILTDNAIAVHNIALLLSFVILGITTYSFVIWLTDSWFPAVIAGALAMAMPWRLMELGHLQLLSAQWLPLIWMFAGRIATGESNKHDPTYLAIVLSIQLLSSFYLAYFAVFSTVVVITILTLYGRRWPKHFLFGIAVGIGIPILILGLTAIPYLSLDSLGQFKPVMPVSNSPGFRRLWEAISGGYRIAADRSIFPSYFLPLGAALLAAVGVVTAFFVNRVSPLTKLDRFPWVVALVGIAVFALIMMLGRTITIGNQIIELPYAWASRFVPGFAVLRGTVRWGILVGIVVPVLVGLGIANLVYACGRLGTPALAAPLRHVALASCLILLVATTRWFDLPVRFAFSEPFDSDAYVALEGFAPGPVVEFPWPQHVGRLRWESQYTLASTLHWHRLLNGYTGYPPKTYQFIQRLANRLPDLRAIEQLVKLAGLRWVVIHRDIVSPVTERRWKAAAEAELVSERYSSDLTIIYEIAVRRDSGIWTGPLVEKTERQETFAGLPRDRIRLKPGDAALDAKGPKRISIITGLSNTSAFSVTVSNRSDLILPGFDIDPKGLVAIRYSFLDVAANRVVKRGLAPIDADVPPHTRIYTKTFLRIPRDTGHYRLKLELIQSTSSGIALLPAAPTTLDVEITLYTPAI